MSRTLNSTMEFDHVIHVDWTGDVTEPDTDAKGKSIYAPEVEFIPDAQSDPHHNNSDIYIGDDRWKALEGFTGQYGYNGPIMHESEFVSGGLERYILANPGYYVVCTVPDDNDEYREPFGWVALFREDDWHNPECTTCKHEHDKMWCQICDDHCEAIHAGFGDVPCDCGDSHDD